MNEEENIIRVAVIGDGEEVLRDFVGGRSDMTIGSYKDELDKISARVEKLGEALNAFKESGINWRVFNTYLRGKGISQKEINTVMDGVESFFKALGIEIK